jgi:myo-inositol-hexaphosphate 3-phosphohydrolase
LAGGNRLYSYVEDTNIWLDVEGLSGWLLGKNLTKAGHDHGGLVTASNRSFDWQAHHVIPQETWKNNEGFFKEVGFKGKHSAANGVFLPNSSTKASQFGGFSVYHSGSHNDYSNLVERRIQRIESNYRIHQDKAQAKAELEDLQKRLKTALSRKGEGAKRLH